jgi:lipopolysaccharide export system protein LptA
MDIRNKETRKIMFMGKVISENEKTILCADMVDVYELPKDKYEVVKGNGCKRNDSKPYKRIG